MSWQKNNSNGGHRSFAAPMIDLASQKYNFLVKLQILWRKILQRSKVGVVLRHYKTISVMNREDRYEKLGEIANNANGSKIKGSDIAYIVGLGGRALFSAIAAAYRYFYAKGDGNTAETIARTFVDKDGNYAYRK